jgi:hypothetical protein
MNTRRQERGIEKGAVLRCPSSHDEDISEGHVLSTNEAGSEFLFVVLFFGSSSSDERVGPELNHGEETE